MDDRVVSILFKLFILLRMNPRLWKLKMTSLIFCSNLRDTCRKVSNSTTGFLLKKWHKIRPKMTFLTSSLTSLSVLLGHSIFIFLLLVKSPGTRPESSRNMTVLLRKATKFQWKIKVSKAIWQVPSRKFSIHFYVLLKS